MNTITSWLKWSSLAGVFYCCLCFLAIFMALQGGLFPEPGTPPPSPFVQAISATGRTMLIVLTKPVAVIRRSLPGKAIPGIDYLYFFATGFAIASVIFWGWKCNVERRKKPTTEFTPTK